LSEGDLLHVPLNDPGRLNAALQDELEAAIQRVVRSGRYVLGEEVSAFEEAFAAFCGTRYCIGVGNGTDALELALKALDLKPGDQVATVANAGMYASAAILAAGAQPLFIDIDPASMNMSAASLTEKITEATKVVVVTHLYGRLAAMEDLHAVTRGAGISLIEDCAQAHGAERDGRRAGSYGDIGCFSFYPTKNLGALGDGGALVTNDAELGERLVSMRQYGWRQRFVSTPPLGRNSRLDELQAAVLRVKLQHLPKWNAKRRAVVERYGQALADLDLDWPVMSGLDYAAHLCVVRTPARDRLQVHLARKDIGAGIHYPLPDYRQPSIMAVLGQSEPLPETEAAAASILSLPCFPDMSEAEMDAVISAIESAEL
jgi:dTDP-3-amino-2,3,6-trideoxy-4-keto-D-glucose/dTDP-3-amino-3,4,6-trideoxy-alpha-D-glucose/dTDP-2,6-dideoxy-D-kanosamine transaminase